MENRLNVAAAAIFSLLLSSLVLLSPSAPAQATGGGLSVSIRKDERSLAWVKSQGFDAWFGGECYSASNLVLTKDWGQAEPAAGCGVDNFQMFATGFIEAPATGQFHFRVIANDAFELRINGKEVLKYWADSTGLGKTFLTTNTQAQNLVSGNVYPISFWYRDFTKEAHFKVQWKYPGSGDFADIPVQYLDDSAGTLLGAGNQQEIVCASGIGSSPECPAYSPQEIFQVHGTETDGEYWLLVAGVPTKVHVILDPGYAVNSVSGFVQLMHIPSANGGGYTGLSSAGARFNYDSPLWTDDYLTLNANAGPTAMASKRNTYNYTPISRVLAIYKGAANYSLGGAINSNWTGSYTSVTTGDISISNATAGSDFVWIENVPAFANGKPARFTFDNQVFQTESVVEPVNDSNPAAGVTTTSRSVKRIKIAIDQTRKNKLLGLVIDRKGVNYDNKLTIQANKTGAFAAAKNPYNEWYGFNFLAREWTTGQKLLKMRWGYFSMGYQKPFSKISSDGRDWSSGYTNLVGEQAPSSIYAPAACNDGGCGEQLQYSFYGPKSRYLAIGGIGLQDANAAAYQPYDSSLSEVVIHEGSSTYYGRCPVAAGNYARDVFGQYQLGYKCAYTAGLYGQMPNPSFTSVSAVTATTINGGFEVTWSAVAGATEYVFAHRKVGEAWKSTRILNPVTLSQVVAERGPGTYEFKVSARKYDSPISFSSSVPTTASKEVGVGLGGGDELLIAGSAASVDLQTALSSSRLALSGLLPNTTVGLTVTVTSASATISTVTGLSTYSNLTNPLSSAITLNGDRPTITLYGSTSSIQAALDSIGYQHLDPLNPEGLIKIEAFDSGNSEYVFNPINQHYYKRVTGSASIGFRDVYCYVKTGSNHKTGSDGYDNCNSGTGRANYNGVLGYPATITSLQELDWITRSGLVSHLIAATSIANTEAGPSNTYKSDDIWIGATDLLSNAGTSDTLFRWTDLSPTAEANQLAHDWGGSEGLVNSSISGIKTHQRSVSKLSLSLIKTNISGYPQYLFANADSGDNDTIESYLIEYSDANGKNPLYKSRTIRFALAPEINSNSVASVTSTGAQVSIGIDSGNSSTTIEVSYSAVTPTGEVSGFAQVSPAITDSSGVVSANFSGLQPFTTYSYTATVTNTGGTDTISGTFMTGAGVAQPLPLSATNLTSNSATLGVSVRPNANSLNSITLEYSTNASLTSATSAAISVAGLSGTQAQNAVTTVTGLQPNTTYYFRTTVVNSAGSSTSEILSFTTGKDLSSVANTFGSPGSNISLPGGVDIKANHPSIFPVDFNKFPAQDAIYVSYTLKNTAASKLEDLWVSLQDFTGGSVRPAFPGDTTQFIGDLSAGQSKTVYFFLKATELSEVDQKHVVTVTQGQPGTDAASTSSSIVFTFDAVRDLGESSSSIRDVRFNTSAPPLGGDFKVTALGNLSSFTSAGDAYFLSPAVVSSWQADSLRLDQIRLVFPNITSTLACPSVVIDLQLISNSCYQGQNFEVTYNFKVIDTPASSVNISPGVLTGGSGGWIGNDTAENPALISNLRPQQNLSVNTTVSDAATSSQEQIAGVTYSQVTLEIDIQNSSLRSSSLDQVLVDLETTTLFDPATAYLSVNGTRYSVSASVVDSSSNLVAIDGPIPAKAGDDVKLVLEVKVPIGSSDTVGVTGKIGDVSVGPAPGTATTATIEVDNSGAISASATTTAVTPRIDAVAASEVFGTTANLRAKVSEGAAGVTVSFRIGQSSDLSFNTDVVSGSPYLTTGASFETFDAIIKGLTPGSTYYYQALYNGVPSGEILSFTTLKENQPFVALSSQPLPVAAICNETELPCAPTTISPPVISCADCSVSYTVSSGALPPGMSLNSQTGVISGTPTGTGGTYPFTLTATATGSDPSASPMVASQAYNFVTQPATAEPKIQSAAAGNISRDSAIITATGAYIPSGDLIKIVVRYTDSNSVLQTLVNEVISEGTGANSQLISFDLKNLLASTTYSYQLIFGAEESSWFEFTTTAVETLPTAASVNSTTVKIVDSNTAQLAATISNPLPGDALGFVVGTNQALTDGKTYIAASSEASTQQAVSSEISNLAPGTYYYRVLLGDALSPLTYPFSVGVTQNNSSGGGSGAGTSSGGSSSSSSSGIVEYKLVTKKFSFYFKPGSTSLSASQAKQLTGYLQLLPKPRFATKITAVGWVAAKPVLASDFAISLKRAKAISSLVSGKYEAQVKAVGKARDKSSSKSSRRVDVWVSYQIPSK